MVPPVGYPNSNQQMGTKEMDEFRDKLAEAMWRDYQIYVKNGGSRIIPIEEDDDYEPGTDEEDQVRHREMTIDQHNENEDDIEME